MRGFVSSLSLCAVFALLNSDVAAGNAVWKFGQENPDSQVVGRQVGEMQYLQKSTRIPLKVPKCYKVTEVKVEIEDSVDTPTVTYDEGALTVTISFTQKQTGLAVYDIIIQGRKIVGCRA